MKNYDYRNKEMDNFRNDHSQKTVYTGYGDMEVYIFSDWKGEFELQIVKNIRIQLLRT